MDIWEAAIGEELNCKREPSNSIDRYAMAIVKGDMVVGHLPKKLLIRMGGASLVENRSLPFIRPPPLFLAILA